MVTFACLIYVLFSLKQRNKTHAMWRAGGHLVFYTTRFFMQDFHMRYFAFAKFNTCETIFCFQFFHFYLYLRGLVIARFCLEGFCFVRSGLRAEDTQNTHMHSVHCTHTHICTNTRILYILIHYI